MYTATMFVNVKKTLIKFTFIGGQHYSTEKAMAPHSSTLAWKIPWMEEPGRARVKVTYLTLQSMGSISVGHD